MKTFTRLSIPAAISLAVNLFAGAAAPAGYYSSCEGKTGEALLKALHQTISSHTNVGYDGLWEVYKTSDVDENGKIWDMYSTKRWSTTSGKCGNYSTVGDCYNREHSFPKSWFGGKVNPMYADAFHLYPTDGKVNGQRSSFPYGECANGTNLGTHNGVTALGRLGTSTFSGYSGTVFEPDDQYKGDFARSYFYMAACYNDKIANWSWNTSMLAENSYPVFKTWAVNLLLKWARQDEVSTKETKRNDAVYAYQKNRNPFIDHPELIEYIWGKRVGEPWYADQAATLPGELIQPEDGSEIDLGTAAAGTERTLIVYLKTKNATDDIYVFISGDDAFSVSPETISAETANQGTNLTVKFKANEPGDYYASLNIVGESDDEICAEVSLMMTVEEGMPAVDATNVTTNSFVANWIYLNDQTTYTLDVRQGNTSIAGYPRQVNAADESYEVTGLEPYTTYTYTISNGTYTSEAKSVTTADLIPEIAVLFDGELEFAALVGEPSEIAELLLEIENISSEINVSVNAPFQISTDKTNWSTTLTLDAEESRIYMRMLGNDPGTYGTSITFTAGDYVNDDAEASGTITTESEATDFIETFDVDNTEATKAPTYGGGTFTGTACQWKATAAGLANQDYRDTFAKASGYGVRMDKKNSPSLTMLEDKSNGIGEVSLQAMSYSSSENPTITVEYSGDGGTTWETVGTFTTENNDYEGSAWKFTVNKVGNGRLRFKSNASGRCVLDNIAITNYVGVNSVQQYEYHSWDAYCLDGRLVIESPEKANEISIYGMDGLTWFNETVSGTRSLELPRGLYIVASNGFSRRVLVK